MILFLQFFLLKSLIFCYQTSSWTLYNIFNGRKLKKKLQNFHIFVENVGILRHCELSHVRDRWCIFMWWWSNYISCNYFRFSFSTVFVDYSCSAFGPAYRQSFCRAGVVRPSTPPYTFCLSWYRFLKNYQFFFFDYSREIWNRKRKKNSNWLYTPKDCWNLTANY